MIDMTGVFSPEITDIIQLQIRVTRIMREMGLCGSHAETLTRKVMHEVLISPVTSPHHRYRYTELLTSINKEHNAG